ncbi:lamin tail domain-containing protein [Candidatus Woesearchaeota archaeon]|nr:lamin tail domain-containing protein [Candidatus Woesearchaeota archaeon]
MKIKNLVILGCILFLLNISLVLAIAPFIEFTVDSTSVASEVQLRAKAVDASPTNRGISWIRFYYDNGTLIEEKNCGNLPSCKFITNVTQTSAGNYTFYARAWNRADQKTTSSPVTVWFSGKTHSTCSLTFSPASPQTYGTPVNASCSCDNPEASAVLTRNGADVTASENNQLVVLGAGPHNYNCSVIETPNYSSAENLSTYDINQAPTVLNLTALPSWTESVGVQTTVSCIADNSEVAVSLFRDGSPVASNPDVQTLANGTYVYTCNATASQNYSAPAQQQNTLTINTLPPVNVVWNSPVLNMGSTFSGTIETDFENITSAGANTNVNIACTSGDCSTFTNNWINGTNMADAETQQVDFICNNSVVGNYSALFDVTSDEFPAGDQINVSCEIIPVPPVLIQWNQAVLDLGSGEQGAGALTGSENITASGDDHTNVNVACTGDCTEITNDWTNGSSMFEDESLAVTFTCSDTAVGAYSAVFDVVSDEDTTPNQITVNCDITIPIASTGNVLLNEFLADGTIPTTEDDEFIEIYNNDSVIIDLDGWNIGDTSSNYTIPSGTLLNPGSFFAVNKSVSSIALSNSGDTINVYDSLGALIDTYTYTASAEGISSGLYPDGVINTWQDMLKPTPGASNLPLVNVLWNQAVLDLGTGDQGAGALTGTADIISMNANTNVNVACTGDCTEITHNWTNGTNMADAETQTVGFSCDDTTVGVYSAVFDVVSDEFPTGDQITLSCEILLVPVYGVTLTDPSDLTVDDSTNAVYTITITNTGNQADVFDLARNNIDGAATADLNQSTVSLAAGASADITLTVADSTSGTYAVNVTAASQTDITVADEIQTITTVTTGPVYGVSVANLDLNQEVTNTQTAVYSIQITNAGNQVDSFDLIVNNLDNADTASISPILVTNINPGATANVLLSVADSTPGLYTVTVTAVSQTDSNANDTTADIQTNIVQAVGSMSGTVSDGTNNIYNAKVELRQGASVIASTNTDANGDYSFSNVDVGTYDVAVIKSGFNDDVQSVTLNDISNTVHDVILTPASFAGTITGTILDGTDGVTTVSGATVTITRSDTAQVVQIAASDGSGDYVFLGLQPTVGFTYNLDVNVPYSGYTQAFPPIGLSLTSGQTRTGENIYLIS